MSPDNTSRPIGVASTGHAIFALTLVWLGAQGVGRAYLPPTWAGVPETLPGYTALVYLIAIISLLSGIGMLWRRTVHRAAALLLATFGVWLVAVRVTHIFTAPRAIDTWWGFGDTFAMGAAPLILFAWSAGDRPRFPRLTGARGVRLAQLLYGLAMFPFGIAHFLFLKETAALVPSYLPWHTAFAVATGCAFLATGVAVLTRRYARVAVDLSVVQMGLFTILVWVPVVMAGPSAGQWAEFVQSIALTAAGWVVADSYRDGTSLSPGATA